MKLQNHIKLFQLFPPPYLSFITFSTKNLENIHILSRIFFHIHNSNIIPYSFSLHSHSYIKNKWRGWRGRWIKALSIFAITASLNYLFHFLLGAHLSPHLKNPLLSRLNPSLYRCWGQRSSEPLTTRFLTIDVKRHVHKGSRDVWNKGSGIRNFIFFTFSLTFNKGKPHSTNT